MLLLFLVGATAGTSPPAGSPRKSARPVQPVVVDEARRLEEDNEEAILLLLMAQADLEEWN